MKGSAEVRFAVIPDQNSGACSTNQACPIQLAALDRLTIVASHELVEAVTDPNGAGWIDQNAAVRRDRRHLRRPAGPGGGLHRAARVVEQEPKVYRPRCQRRVQRLRARARSDDRERAGRRQRRGHRQRHADDRRAAGGAGAHRRRAADRRDRRLRHGVAAVERRDDADADGGAVPGAGQLPVHGDRQGVERGAPRGQWHADGDGRGRPTSAPSGGAGEGGGASGGVGGNGNGNGDGSGSGSGSAGARGGGCSTAGGASASWPLPLPLPLVLLPLFIRRRRGRA